MLPRVSLFAAALTLSIAAAAQDYPSHTISMVVPYAAGGPTDTVARVVAQAMSKPLGETVVVENRPSAGGILAPQVVKNAKPDGYQILIHHIGMSTIPSLYRNPGFDPLKDFEYIGLVNEVPMTIIGKPSLPAKDLKELLAYIKANKDKVNYANAGIGAASHLCGMLFMQAIQTDITTVPYKGTGPAMNDLVGGQVDMMFDAISTIVSHIKGGKITFRVDKHSNLHLIIGKASFATEQLVDNYAAVLDEILRAKPSAAKGRYLRKVFVTTTMGPSPRASFTSLRSRSTSSVPTMLTTRSAPAAFA